MKEKLIKLWNDKRLVPICIIILLIAVSFYSTYLLRGGCVYEVHINDSNVAEKYKGDFCFTWKKDADNFLEEVNEETYGLPPKLYNENATYINYSG